MINNALTYIMSQTAGAAFFTVDNTKESVQIQLPLNSGLLHAGNMASIVPGGNNLNLITIGFSMPLGFDIFPISDDQFFYQRIKLFWKHATGQKIEYFQYIMPFENFEMSINTFLSFGSLSAENYQLFATFDPDHLPSVSMLGVPDQLNEKKLFVPIFIKVQATLAMIIAEEEGN